MNLQILTLNDRKVPLQRYCRNLCTSYKGNSFWSPRAVWDVLKIIISDLPNLRVRRCISYPREIKQDFYSRTWLQLEAWRSEKRMISLYTWRQRFVILPVSPPFEMQLGCKPVVGYFITMKGENSKTSEFSQKHL